jgi:hypothetical protein
MGFKVFFLAVVTSLTLAATAEAGISKVSGSLSSTTASNGQIVTAKAGLLSSTTLKAVNVDIHYLGANGVSVARKQFLNQTLYGGVVANYQFDYQVNLPAAQYLVVIDVQNSNYSSRLYIKDIGYVSVVAATSSTQTVEAENFTTKTTGSGGSDGIWALWSNGYIENSFNFLAAGSYTVRVAGYATLASGVGADTQIYLDGVAQTHKIINSTTLTNTDFTVNVMAAGSHRIAVAFINDAVISGQDRNLLLDKVSVISGTLSAPAPATSPTPTPTPTVTSTPVATAQPDFTKLNPSCYIPYSSSPLIQNNSFISGSHWNDPHVLKVGNQFVMYASADLNWTMNIQIYRFVSNDGINWSMSPSTPVLSRSAETSAYDHGSIETPAVTYFNGLYYMFYTTYQSDYTNVLDYKIGYAVSADGINFTKKGLLVKPSNPYGAAGYDQFDQYIVGEPGPIVFNNKLYLYFAATGPHPTLGMTSTVGMIETSDGSNWSAPQRVLVPDQTLYPRNQNWKGYSTPHAAVLGGKVHLYFDVATDQPFQQVRIHHAVSADGKTGWVHDSKAIFSYTQFPWTSHEVRSPAVVMNGTQLMLYFAGDNGSNLGIGLARCQL